MTKPVNRPYLKTGRPSKYRPEFCQLVEDIGNQGLSLTVAAARIGVARQKLNEWMDMFPPFRESCDRAKDARAAYWEMQSRDIAKEVSVTGGRAQINLFMLQAANPSEFQRKPTLADAAASLEDILLAAAELRSRKALPEPTVIEHDPPDDDATEG